MEGEPPLGYDATNGAHARIQLPQASVTPSRRIIVGPPTIAADLWTVRIALREATMRIDPQRWRPRRQSCIFYRWKPPSPFNRGASPMERKGDRLDHWDLRRTRLCGTLKSTFDETRPPANCPNMQPFACGDLVLKQNTHYRRRNSHRAWEPPRRKCGPHSALTIPGSEAGGRLTLRTRLVLRYPRWRSHPSLPRRIRPFSGRSPTSQLKAERARFPITAD